MKLNLQTSKSLSQAALLVKRAFSGLVQSLLLLSVTQASDLLGAVSPERKDSSKSLAPAPVRGATPTNPSLAASSPSPTSSASGSSTSSETHPVDRYVIVANDVLWLKVYQEDDLESKPKVGRDGTVNLPLLGSVLVSGLTVEQAREKIRAELDRRFIVNPQVSLTVAEYSKRKFVVLGQVQRTGIYEYSGEEKITVIQAIGMAGGFTRLASTSRVLVQRQENGVPRTLRVDAEAIGGVVNGAAFEILPDDTITVGTRLF